VQAARVVARDVAAIDLNCGCPKPFSTHAGMGAALLSTPDLLLNIVRALVRAIPLPISAKIRLLPTRAATMRLAARILATGVRNLTVHCRTRDMRPGEKAIHERLGEVVALGRERGVSVTCNGDGEGWTNWEAVKAATGADSLMIARAAESNPSCFAPEVQDATTVVVPQLLSWAAHSGHNWGNTKFLLAQYKAAGPTLSKQQKKDAMAAVSRGKSVQEVAEGLAIVVPDRDMTVSAERGAQFMRDLEERLRARPEWAVWEAAKAQAEAEVDAMLAAAAVKAEEAPATAATEPAPPLTEEAPAPAVAVCAPEAPAKAE
jgi:tRNA-dihydrouridine synthase 2